MDSKWPGFTVLDYRLGTSETELECTHCGHIFAVDLDTEENMTYVCCVVPVPQCPECGWHIMQSVID